MLISDEKTQHLLTNLWSFSIRQFLPIKPSLEKTRNKPFAHFMRTESQLGLREGNSDWFALLAAFLKNPLAPSGFFYAHARLAPCRS